MHEIKVISFKKTSVLEALANNSQPQHSINLKNLTGTLAVTT
jgi:hypothetical protein